jgi:glycosyltransferase involved in cell wall biosynthesis
LKPLRIAYLFEDTELAGGLRIAIGQADGLTARGHDVTLITKGGPLSWRKSDAKWEYVDSFDDADLSRFEFVIGTFWKTLPFVHRLAGSRGIHLCQGYEGSFTAYRDIKPQIDAAYRLPLPKITISPHLTELCKQFNDDAQYVGPVLDDIFFREPTLARPDDGTPMRVLLVGPMQADFKGLDVGYDAVRRARARGAQFDLVRVSQWPAADDEPATLASEFHIGLKSPEMARLYSSCHVFLGPSRHQEGFGLPAGESMASGIATVLSAIPSFLSFDPTHDYALFTPEDDGTAMGDALVTILADEPLRRRTALRGRQVVEQFRAHHTALRMERYFFDRRAR